MLALSKLARGVKTYYSYGNLKSIWKMNCSAYASYSKWEDSAGKGLDDGMKTLYSKGS